MMIGQNKMTPAGMVFYEELLKNPGLRIESVDNSADLDLPEELKMAFRDKKVAMDFFMSCPRSYRNMCIRWVDSAKKSETRERRSAELVTKSNKREKIGLK